jgi:hypothetical protein
LGLVRDTCKIYSFKWVKKEKPWYHYPINRK